MKTASLSALMNVCLVVLMATTSISHAQPMRMSPDERTAQLKKELNLADDQAVKMKKILEDQQKETQKLFDAAGEDRSAMRETMMKVREETDKKIATLLTDEQKTKFYELQKQRRNRFDQGRKPRD